jgi:bifunctional UDP-N-acetylglucosamine pyrophosphorylase / glucosamine-1-phosphate N-acetyltransferase
MNFSASELLDLKHVPFPELFEGKEPVWAVLSRIKAFFGNKARSGVEGRIDPRATILGEVFIDKGTVVEANALIRGPAYIGKDCEIRSGAYIRGNFIAGNGCVIGNSCEFKNAVLFDEATVPHFAYVGDSILGHKVHLGAGVTLSNVKLIPGNVEVNNEGERIDSGLRKFGAIIGDHAEIGCNCVLNPGSVIGRRSVLSPNLSWRGVCPADSVVKLKQEFTVTEIKLKKKG